jgi:ankyrin repeat protein
MLNMGAAINQRDSRGWTPLHRAAHLAQNPGYLEIYEYLLVRSRGHRDPANTVEESCLERRAITDSSLTLLWATVDRAAVQTRQS